ncbi:MAG: thioesterase family protein [Gordonia sp. (in: high G+C Gram-positive bacteria)]|uniref:thioesterase family protein n=1 Tax=Gordonia sp. (in: high G+C Gram-positive bacteria) TaxID=84139 RepID=UPI003C72D9C5
MDISEVPYTCYYEPLPVPEGQPSSTAAGAAYEYFQPTKATASVWSADMQHGAPPAALMIRALERAVPDDGQEFTRVTTEILGPIGLGVNRVSTGMPRPGRRISMVQADLEAQGPDGSFRVVARTVAWRLQTSDTAAVVNAPHDRLPASPDDLPQIIGFPEVDDAGIPVAWGRIGFIGTTITARQPGRNGKTSALWIRAAIPLVLGEEMTNLEAMFAVLDVANGVGTALQPNEWSWMNMDTTVHLTGQPTSPWLGIDSDLVIGARGYGASFADLYDVTGFLGRSAQSDMIAAQG